MESLTLNKIGDLFTSQAINSVASGNIEIISKTLDKHLDNIIYPITVAEAFDIAFSHLSEAYKSEYLFKNVITTDYFLEKKTKKNAVMLSEFRVGQSKADCVIMNNISVCYEIKTALDNLKRLPEQLNDYVSLFDEVYVVCDKQHLDKVLKISPEEVGVIELTPKNKLICKRKATRITSEVDAYLMINSLRAQEYKFIAEKITQNIINVPNVDLYTYCLDIFLDTPGDVLRKLFRESIKNHRKNNHAFLDSLPRSLKSSAISFNIPSTHQKQLKKIMSMYIQKDHDYVLPIYARQTV